MRKSNFNWGIVTLTGLISIASLILGCTEQTSQADQTYPRPANDLNVDPNILELNLVAGETEVDLTGDRLVANVLAFNGDTPGPLLRLKLGDTAIVHFTNNLSFASAIHWHGIELDNANDGTPVTQNLVQPGETFTYRFVVTRPGMFWYHSHMQPTNPEFKGLYGPIIVDEPAEETLKLAGIIPEQEQVLVLADTTVCKPAGENDDATFAADADTPWVFAAELGPFPGLTAFPTPSDLCDTPRDNDGLPTEAGVLPAGEIPNIQPQRRCHLADECRVNEGQIVLANGRAATPRAGSPEAPGDLASKPSTTAVTSGKGIRLRLLNTAASRYFRLRLTDQNGDQLMLYRVGGQGGLLDQVRLEGGMIGTLESKYDPGEIVLGPAERVDVVAVPQGDIGDVLTLWTLDFQRYGTLEYPFGYGALPSVPVAHFEIGDIAEHDDRFEIAEGDPLRLHEEVNDPIESLKDLPITDHLRDPATFDEPLPGIASEEVLLAVVGLRESIDGFHGRLEGGDVNFTEIPHPYSARYATVGDLLELTIRNSTQMHHPVHLHGFSFQPVRLLDSEDELIYTYDYNEFVDTIDIPGTHKVVIRVRLDDRPIFDGPATGGAVGRWLIHCHIFNHAGLGMISELVVMDR